MRVSHCVSSASGTPDAPSGVGVIRRLRSTFAVIIQLVLVLVLLQSAPSAWAQVAEAGMDGVVTDPSGAAVFGAMVSAKDVETEIVRTTRTDSAGRYGLADLEVGAYEVTVSKDGFETLVQGGIIL